MRLKSKAQRTKNTLQTTGGQAEHGTRNSSSLRRTRRGGELGFSLIEVLVALVILAIGFLGVSLMQVMSISGNTFSKEMAVATALGQDMVEKLKSMEYTEDNTDSALDSGNHPTQDDVDNTLAPALDTDGVPCNSTDNIVDERGLQVGPLVYIRTWTVTNDTPATAMKEIDVTVGWMEKGATCRSVTITGVKVQS